MEPVLACVRASYKKMTTHTTASANTTRTTREEKLDAARAVLNAGFDGMGRDPEALARFLAFRAHFHDYSLNNAVLIWCQRPSARHCMGYRAWQGHGRQVRKGERGLTILAPVTRKRDETDRSSDDDRAVVGYRTATVFDYEQTDAVEDSALVYTPPAPRLNADDPDGLAQALVAAAETLGYEVRHAETGYADGRCSFSARTITLQASLSPADRAAVLCHELAHALAHDPSTSTQVDEPKPTTAQRELQAEGAAFVALSVLGLDTSRASLPYLEGWSGGDAEALRREMTAIDRISRDLLARLDALPREGRPREGRTE